MKYFAIFNAAQTLFGRSSMQEKQIKFVELAESPYGVLVARMLPEFLTQQVNEDISTAHRHDYYSLLLIKSGKMRMTVDFESESLESSSMLLLRPGQVHQTNFAEAVEGWIILFDGKILDQDARFAVERSFQHTILLALDEGNVAGLGQMLDSLLNAIWEKSPGQYHKLFIQTLLSAFLFKAVDLLYLDEAEKVSKYPSRAVEISRQFNQLVKENFRSLKRPSEYADLMNITASYLNDSLKAVTGFSCTHIIQQEVIGEAQRLLFYTSKSVKEIAFALGYQDDKYFMRQFGKITKTTPSRFRKDKTLWLA